MTRVIGEAWGSMRREESAETDRRDLREISSIYPDGNIGLSELEAGGDRKIREMAVTGKYLVTCLLFSILLGEDSPVKESTVYRMQEKAREECCVIIAAGGSYAGCVGISI